MKNKILSIIFIAFAFIANAKCPSTVTYSSPNFTFTYPGSTPSGTYNQLRVTISSGTGAGNSYLLSISSNSGTTIITDNSSGSVDGSSVASKIEYYLSGSPTSVSDCNQNTPLPVELIAFNGKAKDNNVVLNWSTATEINNDKFIVEWSDNGIAFSELSYVPGSGNSNQIKYYNFIDNKHKEGGFYRLKQIDYNGEFEYSHIIHVVNNAERPVAVYPNPFMDNIFVSSSNDNTNYIFSIDGKVLLESTSNQINTEQLKPGVYIFVSGDFFYKLIKF